MRKLVIIVMLLFSMLGFAEKLNTDGQRHLKKLQGHWDSINGEIQIRKDGLYILII